jgi:hypothetical protein
MTLLRASIPLRATAALRTARRLSDVDVVKTSGMMADSDRHQAGLLVVREATRLKM